MTSTAGHVYFPIYRTHSSINRLVKTGQMIMCLLLILTVVHKLTLSFGLFFTVLQVLAMPIDESTEKLINEYEDTTRALFDIFNLGINSMKAKCSERIMRPSGVRPDVAIQLTRFTNQGVYYFSDFQLTHAQARQFCIDHGMHLVTIDSANENALVFARARQLGMTGTSNGPVPPGAWIGLRDSGANNWRWVSNNRPSSLWFFNTDVVAAAPAVGECANYISGALVTDPTISWAGSACTDSKSFICELEYPCNKVVQATNI